MATPRAPRSSFGGAILLVLALAATLDGLACAFSDRVRVPPVEPTASMAFAAGQAHLRAEQPDLAREAFGRAAALDPAWVAPRRALDDLLRADLRGVDALAARRAELAARPGGADLLYLVGRLEGRAGMARFEQAIRLDPDLAWGHHGIAWTSHLAGDPRAALRHGRRALELARDTWERSTFAVAMARYELAVGRTDRAARVLEARLAEPDVLASDRASLEAWLARAELSSTDPLRAERGFQRGLALFTGLDPSEDEANLVAAAMLDNPAGRSPAELATELGAALAAREGPGRAVLRAELLLRAGSAPLALGLLRRDPAAAGLLERPELAAARFATGGGSAAVEEWLGRQPTFVLDDAGLPRDPRLARLVRVARGGTPAELGDALLAAGWFREARALASHLAEDDLDRALDLEARASAGLALLGGVQRLLELVDRGQSYPGPWAPAAGAEDGASEERPAELGPRPINDVPDLLAALEPLFANHRRATLGTGSAPFPLTASPTERYGPFASAVHPGPTYSVADAARGRGAAGAPVPGLAAELDRIGRFGIFGEALGGGGPDGTLLRRVLVEERAGEHLGVPWSGTVAWCDGTDVPSRPGRQGARISGAALHEGYWIDLAAVRDEALLWGRLEEEFLGPEADPGRVDRLLATRGLVVEGPDPVAARTAPGPLLGEGDRVRLAILRERRAAGASRPLVPFEELVEVTAVHEEGHLCDRTRFLPLGRNLLEGFGLLSQGGFSPRGVARTLEYRAQLVALCGVPDPRVPLSDILTAVESGTTTTPHAAGYGSLLRDLLETWNEEIRRDPGRWSDVDGGRLLVHQLHTLGAEDVRHLARELARARGMVE